MKGDSLWWCLLLVGLVTVAGFPTAPGAKVIDRIVAKVNGEIITLSELQEYGLATMARLRDQPVEERGQKAKEMEGPLLEQVIDRKLQLQQAKKLGLMVNDREVRQAIEDIRRQNALSEEALQRLLAEEQLTLEEYKEAVRDQILMAKVLNFEVKAKVMIDEAAVEAYYRTHVSEFTTPEEVSARHILFVIDPKLPNHEEEVRKLAATVLQRLRQGEDFGELARRYSADPSGDRGGDLGTFKRGEMIKEIEEATFRLQAGGLSELVRTPLGYQIIRVDRHTLPAPKPLEEVRGKVKELLFNQRVEQRQAEWLKRLRQDAFIERSL